MATKPQIYVGEKLGLDLRNKTNGEASNLLSQFFKDEQAERLALVKKRNAQRKEKLIENRLETIKAKGLVPGIKVWSGNELLTIRNISKEGNISFIERKGCCSSPSGLSIYKNSNGKN